MATKRERARQWAKLRETEKLLALRRALTEKDRETIQKAREIIYDHFDTTISIFSDIIYGKFPSTILDCREAPAIAIAITSPNQFLRVARKLVSSVKTERVTQEERDEAKLLAKKYSEYGVTITLGRFKGPFPNGNARRPFSLKIPMSSDEKRHEYKHFTRLVDMKSYLKKHCVQEVADKALMDKLNIYLRLHFNKDVRVWSSYSAPIYSLQDKRKKLGTTAVRSYYTGVELERAVRRLTKAAHIAYDERIQRSEYDVVTRLENEYEGHFSVKGQHRGITVSGAVRRPFTVKVGEKRRTFATVEELQEFAEKNFRRLTPEEMLG